MEERQYERNEEEMSCCTIYIHELVKELKLALRDGEMAWQLRARAAASKDLVQFSKTTRQLHSSCSRKSDTIWPLGKQGSTILASQALKVLSRITS